MNTHVAVKAQRNNLDFLRLFLASLVIISHAFPLSLGSERFDPLMRVSHQTLSLASLSVDCFFVLSGYLISASWCRCQSTAIYFQHRILRIYPAYLVAITICECVLVPAVSHVGNRSPGAMTKFIFQVLTFGYLLRLGVFSSNPWPNVINGSLWTIRFEMLCYIAVAGLGLFGLFRRQFWLIVLTALSAVLSGVINFYPQALSPVFQQVLISQSLRLFSYFGAGAVFYAYRNRIPMNGYLAGISAFAVAASLTMLPIATPLLLPAGLTYLMFWIGFHPTIRLPKFPRRGDISYGVYLWGFPVEQSLVYAFPKPLSPIGLAAMALPIAYLLGFVSWHLIEHPALKLKDWTGRTQLNRTGADSMKSVNQAV